MRKILQRKLFGDSSSKRARTRVSLSDILRHYTDSQTLSQRGISVLCQKSGDDSTGCFAALALR